MSKTSKTNSTDDLLKNFQLPKQDRKHARKIKAEFVKPYTKFDDTYSDSTMSLDNLPSERV